jgi:hypothetical protein
MGCFEKEREKELQRTQAEKNSRHSQNLKIPSFSGELLTKRKIKERPRRRFGNGSDTGYTAW